MDKVIKPKGPLKSLSGCMYGLLKEGLCTMELISQLEPLLIPRDFK